jgi:hypothetical protein
LPKNLHRVLPGQQAETDDDHHGHQAQAFTAPNTHPAASGALIAHVFNVVATPAFFPQHGGVLYQSCS